MRCCSNIGLSRIVDSSSYSTGITMTQTEEAQRWRRISDGVYHLPEIIGGPTILLGEHVAIVDTGVPGSEDAIVAAVAELGRTAATSATS